MAPTTTTMTVVAMGGVNDLSGLVRRKKGGASGKIATSSSTTVNPFTTSNDDDRNNDSPLSPLSRLTQQRRGNVTVPTTGTTSADPTTKTRHPKQQPNNKLLCTIASSHTGSVLCVRFSPSGLYLATAGDDSYVNIYTRCAQPSLAKMGNLVGVGNAEGGMSSGGAGRLGTGGGGSGSSTGVNEDIEHWNRIAVCRGHHLDVVGLAWAPDDSHLVSCSLDSVNPIIVWRLYDVLNNDGEDGNHHHDGDGGRLGRGGMTTSSSSIRHMTVHNLHPHKILGRNVHTSTVKGVAFDPAGKYLASSGDDPAICIWRAFDDWGLEARIDSSSGVFRSKKRKRQQPADNGLSPTISKNNNNGHAGDDFEEDDPGELASLSLFRRISFAPDGSHVCGTNATLRGKNIAAMISREGWMASGPQSGGGREGVDTRPPSGAANLVGHKQPVVASRHCPVFFAVPKRTNQGEGSSSDSDVSDEMDDPDEEPEYATLVALGDKRGFVTIWSTKFSRPLFKMQCSESRCTVTDISWGVVRHRGSDPTEERDELVMIVSLLDGYIVALNFDIPTEVGGGSILSSDKTRRIFRAKYGIEDFVGTYCFSPGKHHQPRKRLVDDAGPVLIENAFQLMMEMEAGSESIDYGGSSGNVDKENGDGANQQPQLDQGAAADRTVSDDENVQANGTAEDGKKRHENREENPATSLRSALHAASVASVAAEGVTTLAAKRAVMGGNADSGPQTASTAQVNARLSSAPPAVPNVDNHSISSLGSTMKVPFNVSKILSVDLTSKLTTAMTSTMAFSSPLSNNSNKIIADCTNITFNETASSSSWPHATLTISSGGEKKWKDIIARSNATALAANHQLLVVGTSDGCLYFYGTSPTVGWMSGKAYRAFPPFVLGSPIVQINIRGSSIRQSTTSCCEMVVVSSDGNFFVYTFIDSVKPSLFYKGSIIPAMQHLRLSYYDSAKQQRSLSPPNLARIQITDSNHLMLILILPLKSTGGRSLKGFVYNRDMELWMCISDSNNFVVSDFYSFFPGENAFANSIGSDRRQGPDRDEGMLAKMDRIVRSSSSVIASAKQVYQRITLSESGSTTDRIVIVTRSHCEDRLACSIVLGSSNEFKTWLRYYARCLVSTGDELGLRFLVDNLLNDQQMNSPSFLSEGRQSLNLVGKDLVRCAILPECQSSRSLQRFTNELSMELETLE
jgi:protein HIRA/HIR1